MLVYRLTHRQYAHLLDGKGAALYGGRWNSVGYPVIYTAQHRSLAVLEYRVNNPIPMQELVMVSLEIPDFSNEKIERHTLPENWSQYSYESTTAALGDAWLREKRSLSLLVPSAVVPEEYNVLINPLHEDMHKVQLQEQMPFLLDQRMY